MSRYHFDVRDGNEFTLDDEGLELFSIQTAQDEAARSIADMARDSIRKHCDGFSRDLAVEVRDENGPVLQVKLTFVVDRYRSDA